jgi:hypothetical protein
MASFKNIPITQITSTGIKDIHDHMKLKYMFEPVNHKFVKNLVNDMHFLDFLVPTTETSEDSLLSAKEHLNSLFMKHKHIVGEQNDADTNNK